MLRSGGRNYVKRVGVDPAQYDWPVDHWKAGAYPWDLPLMPLPWIADFSDLLAIRWTFELNRKRRSYRNWFRAFYSTKIPKGTKPKLSPGGGSVDVTLHGPRISGTHKFALVISCVGFGVERSTVKTKYKGFDFWETDPFGKIDLGVPDPGPKVLISGGGDGALQDFLRVVTTARSAKDIYVALQIPEHINRRIQSAEDQAQRGYIWGHNAVHDHPLYTNARTM